jgi:hypothetical protein
MSSTTLETAAAGAVSTPSISASGVTEPEASGSVGGGALPDAVRAFVREAALTKYLETAVELAKSVFPSARDLAVELEHDPEEGDRWVVLRVTTSGSSAEVLAALQAYSAKWVEVVPWPQRHLIRLSFHIA